MRKGDFVPPIIKQLLKRTKIKDMLYYFGSYPTWARADEAARRYGQAYEGDNIIERVAASIQAVRNGEAVYEQDGVLFYEENYLHEFLSAVLYITSHTDEIGVCDLGGSLGSTYFRYREVLPMQRISWNIVEQKHFVDYGKQNIPDIDFYYTIEECFTEKNINTVLLLSVLPYLEDPYGMLDRIFKLSPEYIVIDETVCNVDEDEPESIVLQHVPAYIYEAVYPSNIFNVKRIREKFDQGGYEKVFEWVFPEGSIPIKKGLGFKETVDKGFLYRKKSGEDR